MAAVKLEDLTFEEHGFLLCYPKPSPEEFEQRLRELEELGVEALELSGGKQLGKFQVLGKGTSALVLKALKGGERFALKVRRVDAGRPSLLKEAELTLKANQVKVGPKLHAFTVNMLLLELVEGELFLEWLRRLEAKPEHRRLALNFLSELLLQCRRLDQVGIDHGELSRASKHVLVRGVSPVILDFGKASVERRPANVTAITQFLVVKRAASLELERILGVSWPREKVFQALREYKFNPSEEAFQRVLRLFEG